MADQAEQLRSRLMRMDKPKAKTIAVASGKGGVGKTNFTINFALKLIQQGKRVLIFDLDIGMGNVDILLGVTPKYSIVHLFQEQQDIRDMIEAGPNNLDYIAGGSGLSTLFQLDEDRFIYFHQAFEQLTIEYDFILFDMGAGATEDSLHFITSADEVMIVTTPEPTSITDAYAMIKHLIRQNPALPIHVLINRALSAQAGLSTFVRLEAAVKKFLNKQISNLGVVPDDHSVLEAVTNQLPFVLATPKSRASKAVGQIVAQYLILKGLSNHEGESFISKLKRFVLRSE
ncbi:MinD/ParA family protein [Halobacillus shinanisalinarum]|uniref:MinD/ParA family protein n=1 Tax=Halobacillus shinanisalinarum TaxID=2932258 RepID=A0ABY4GYJ5_9BACI|nr:MinD/ParA family protein [Halobacillus shinanisalinarum]UOQ93238.1 MinD/ParA family protein [Halobacillus shinanisalinarum]